MVIERLVPPLPSGAGQRLIHGDLRQPGRKLCPVIELSQVGVRVDVRFLHHVLGFVIVSDDRAGGPVHTLVVPAHQDLEERRLALEDARDDLFVGKRAETGDDGRLGRHHGLLTTYRVASRQKVTNRRAVTFAEVPTPLGGGKNMDSRLAAPFHALRLALGLTATLAGLDKYFNILANWGSYVSPAAARWL